jgi:hypothetical protein
VTCQHRRLNIDPTDPTEAYCLDCFNTVFIGRVYELGDVHPGTDGARFGIRREPRHDSPNKLKQGTLA